MLFFRDMNKDNLDQQSKKSLGKAEIVSVAFELGFIIALPITLFAFGGKWLDARFATKPLFVLVGVFFAISVTVFWIYRRFKKYF